jgi:hypothetical protein
MAKRSSRGPDSGQRQRLAEEAARLMMEHGIGDFGLAKRKAAERFAAGNAGALPSNQQIEACLAERQRIFAPDLHKDRVGWMRRLAASVMDSLAAFEPRLVGPVLTGTATVNTVIELHLFSDSPEVVADALEGRGHKLGDCERRYRFKPREAGRPVPGFRFVVDGAEIWAMVFPENGLRQAPLSPVDRRPMERAAHHRVAALSGEP